MSKELDDLRSEVVHTLQHEREAVDALEREAEQHERFVADEARGADSVRLLAGAAAPLPWNLVAARARLRIWHHA